VSLNNLFGQPAEEREERELGLKLPEAKATHSYEMFKIAAKFTSASKISLLVEPLREVLLTTQTIKTVHCIEEALRQIGLGLQDNTSVSATSQLKFILDVLSHGLQQMQAQRIELNTEMANRAAKVAKPDLYSNQLLPEEPSRAGKKPEVAEHATAHVLVAFGLQLLLSGVKRKAFDFGNEEQMKLLDTVLPVVVSCAKSQHNRVLSLSLRTLSHIIPIKKSSFQPYLDQLLPQLFSLLKQYSRAGSAVNGSNQELSQACFKTITVIIRNNKKCDLSEKDLKVWLKRGLSKDLEVRLKRSLSKKDLEM
jgi:U3 small nucleolar RNA-associated protein 20